MYDNKMPPPPENIRKSLTEIIEYLWEDELKHMRSVASNDPRFYLSEHVFVYLMNVRAWIEPKYLPAEIKSQARKLAVYILQEIGHWVPEIIHTAALQVYSWPGDILAIQKIVGFLPHKIQEAEHWEPPNEIQDALDQVRCWLDAAMNV